MRQYWRDENSLFQWTRSDTHRQWWQSFLKDSGGTGFWHETYFRRGGIEAVYGDVPENIGLMTFAPVLPARGPLFWRSSEGGKGICRASCTVGGRALRGARSITVISKGKSVASGSPVATLLRQTRSFRKSDSRNRDRSDLTPECSVSPRNACIAQTERK